MHNMRGVLNILQLNYVTSWIDGSFIYSTSEVHLNTMRTFRNGSFRVDAEFPMMPPRNSGRAPMDNKPMPHVLKTMSAERMYCEYGDLGLILVLNIFVCYFFSYLLFAIREEHPWITNRLEDPMSSRRCLPRECIVSTGI